MKKLFTSLFFALLLVVMMMSSRPLPSAIAAEQPSGTSIVVKLKAGLSTSERAAVIARDGGVSTSSIPALRMYIVAVPDGGDPNQILQNYQSDPQVERAELNKERQAEALPNDTLYGVQWAMPKIGWDRVFGMVVPSGNATVALLDTGVYANHPDLGDNVVLPGVSMLDASDGRTDPNGHGTWLAGVIGAVADNGVGIAGICTSGVKILPVTVLNANGIGKDGDIIAGIVWAADHDADVILMGFSNTDFSQSLQDAIDYAWEKGAVLVAAAGNAGVDIPAFPAGNRGVIGVSATTQDDVLSAGSNYGQAVFLAAPGENIYTTNPGQDLYAYVSGTSASSAVVAGVATFMKAVDSTLTNGVIVGRLAASADAVGIAGDPNNTVMFGNGRVNMANALANRNTDSIKPAGAAPVGSGGPYVGPYAAAGQFGVSATFSANTSTISALGAGLNANWIYQYAYETPVGAITYRPCTPGPAAGSDSFLLASGYPTGTWKVYLFAYNPSYYTCLNNGSATKTAITTTDVAVTQAYMNVAPATGTYGGSVTLSATLTVGTPLSDKTVTFTLNGMNVGSAVTNSSGVATLYNVSLGAINAGEYPTGIGASFAGDGVYLPSSAVGGLTVAQATPTITAWPTASAITYGQALSVSTLSGGSASVAGTFSFAAPATMPNAGTYSATVIFTPGDANHTAVSGSVNVTVNKATPTVTAWPTASAITYGQALSVSTFSGGGASVAGSFSFAAPATVPIAGTYSAAVVFTPTDGNYNTVSGSVDVTVGRATPIIAPWPAASAITYGQALSASTLSGGGASVTGSFSFSAPATVPTAGVYSAAVVFTPVDPNYNAVNGSVAVTVNKATPAVTAWPTASAITYGQALSASALSGGGASVAGSFSFTAPATMPNAGTYGAVVIFTPVDANYNTVSGSVGVTVNKATPTMTAWPAASAITYGQALSASTLSGGGASVPGSFSFAAPATVPNAGVYNAVLTFTPDDANYSTVSGSVAVTVSKATPSITAWPTASAITYGQALSASTLSGGNASVAGSFFFTAPTTRPNAGTFSAAVTFSPSDGANYYNSSGTVTVSVSPALQSINFGSLPGTNFSLAPLTVSATATSGLPVSFTTLTATVCTVSGDTVTILDVGTCTIEASQSGSTNYYPAIPVAQSFTVNPGELDHFAVSAVNTPQEAGTPFSITLTAQDAWNHTVTSFTGTATMSTTAGTITPAVTQPFVDGVWTGTVMVTGAGAGKTITATANSRTGTGNPFDVTPGSAVAFSVTAPVITSAGIPFDITVTAKDAYDNMASGYTGTVHFTSTDPKGGITLPADYSYQAGDGGTRTFVGVVLETAGTQTITAADTVNSSITGTSGSIAVSPAEAAKLSITAPATVTAGTAFNITVTVRDVFDNTIGGYTGTVSFTSSDLQAAVPANYTFVSGDGGSHTFVGAVNMKSSGTHTVTAVDLSTPGITGTSGSIAINPAAASLLVFSQQPTITVPGQPITPAVTLTIKDQYGNVVTGSSAEVTLAIASGGHGGTLSGSTTRNAVNGITTFDDLSINTEGNGYILVATSGSLPPITSTAFDIIVGTCGKPASLSVPATNDTGTIPITWSASDVSGATYILEQSKDGGVFTQVYRGTNLLANIVISASGTYTYRVTATKDGYNPSGYTLGSNGCVAILTAGAPPALTVPPTNSTGVIRIDWNSSDVSGATYILEQSKDGGGFTQVYSGTSLFTNVTVTANGTYTYRVKATKEGYLASTYTLGNTGCAVHLACGAPPALTVPPTNSTGIILISWSPSDVSGATYILEQSKDGGAFTQVYSGTNTYANVAVTANGTYTYRVKAQKTNYDTSGYTPGNTGCAVHLACGASPALTVPPTNSTGIIVITWSASDVSGATYVVEQSKDGGAFSQVYSGTDMYANVAVTANGTYTYRVKAQKLNYDTSDYTLGSTGCAVHLACGAPPLLTVPPTNSTGIFYINWSASDVVGATYVVEQSKDGGAFSQVYSGMDTYTNVTVTANGTYTYRVKALKTNYDTSGYTPGNTGCAVYLACGAPPLLTVPPTNSTGVISLNWNASDVNGATYVVEQSKDGGAFSQVYSGTDTYTNVTVTANGTYTYRVKAQKTNYDTSAYTPGNTGCAVHLACGAPPALTVPPTNSTGVVSLSWSPSDVIGATYVVEQSKDGGAFTSVYSGTNTHTNVTVTANGTYTYRVKAQKTNYDTSAYTPGNTGCAVHLACGAPPALTVPPTNSTGVVSLSWSASDVSGSTYVVEQSKDGGAFTQVYSGTDTYANIGVTANGTYTYRVKAQKTNYDTSDYTPGNTGCAVHLACGAPPALTVPPTNNTGTISLSWSASDVSGATYVVEQSKDGGAFTQVYSGTNTYTNIAVVANGTYTYRVKAQKANYDTSDYTPGNTGCVVYLACGAPSSLTVPPTNSTGTISISWGPSDVSGATYVVEQSKDGGAFTQVYSGTNTYANVAVTANGTYTYRVKALKTNYDASDWTTGSTACVVTMFSKVKLSVSGQPDLYFLTLSAAISSMPNGVSAVLSTWETAFVENLDMGQPDSTLTIGSAYDPSYTTQAGPIVIQGNVTITSGGLVVDNLVIR